MVILDILILVPLIWSAYKGFTKGLMIELLTLVAIVASIVLSFKLLHGAIILLKNNLEKVPPMLPVLVFVGLFVGILVILVMLNNMFKNIVYQTPLKSMDNALGALLGLFKAALLVSSVLWLINKSEAVFGKEILKESVLAPIIMPITTATFKVFSIILPFVKDLLQDLELFLK